MEAKQSDLKKFMFIWVIIFSFLSYYINNYFIVAIFITLLIYIVTPKIFKRLYFGWIKFGGFIGNINSHIIMFIVYFFLITPIGLLLRVFGKDLLSKKMGYKEETYWVEADTVLTSMKNQF